MIRSMTGFGRSEVTDGTRKVVVEIKSVNNRFLDLSMKMPRKFNCFDARIRTEIKKYLLRGKVDLFISYENSGDTGEKVCYNQELAAEYLKYLRSMSTEFGIDDDVRVSTLSRLPDILTVQDSAEEESEEIWPLLKEAIDEAGEAILSARSREGSFLAEDIYTKLDDMLCSVDFITERSPEIVESYKKKLTEKIHDLLGDSNIDESRIAEEVTIYADKICVDEELVRLRSHIEGTRKTLMDAGKQAGLEDGVGRRLDFLAQEMNREANTILSKTDDVEVSEHGIRLKTNIEKVREQIQNLE